jgi:hypothetical protein
MGEINQNDQKAFFETVPVPGCVLIDFDEAFLRNISQFLHILLVHGTKPYRNMVVSLRPRVYIHPPEYWAIGVVGCHDGIVIPATEPYAASLLIDFARESKGVEVIGANRSVKIDF